MSYIVTHIKNEGDYSTIKGPEINIRFKGPAFVSKVPNKEDQASVITPQGITLIFSTKELISIDDVAPSQNIDDLIEQIILAMP
jgi:hypothetical protein